MTFSIRLAEIMKARRMNQSDVARALGITPQAVGQWGKHGGTMPTGAKLKKIADALSVTEADLVSPVGSPFADFGLPAAISAPKKSRLVDKPDELALLEFWDDLGSEEERIRAFRILKAAASPISKRS